MRLRRLPRSRPPSLVVELGPVGTVPAELVTAGQRLAASARTLLAVASWDAMTFDTHNSFHVSHPVVDHEEVAVPHWVPTGFVAEVPFLHLEIIGQVRREHRRTVHVLTIHPSWEVSHGCGEVVSCQLTQNSSRKAMSKTNLQESLKRRPNRKQLCSRKPGNAKRPLKFHGKPAEQEALVISAALKSKYTMSICIHGAFLRFLFSKRMPVQVQRASPLRGSQCSVETPTLN